MKKSKPYTYDESLIRFIWSDKSALIGFVLEEKEGLAGKQSVADIKLYADKFCDNFSVVLESWASKSCIKKIEFSAESCGYRIDEIENKLIEICDELKMDIRKGLYDEALEGGAKWE